MLPPSASGRGEPRFQIAEQDGAFGGDRADLHLGARLRQLIQAGELGRVEEHRGRHLLAPGPEVHVAEVEPRDGHAPAAQPHRIADLAQQEERPRRLRALAARLQHLGGGVEAHDLEVDPRRDGQRHGRARQHVAGGLVVRHQDALRVQGRQPRLQDLAMNEPVVDAHQRNARWAQPILRNDSLRWPMERWPASARSCAICAMGLPLARSPESLSSIGRLTPVTTSTWRSVRKETHRLVGDPPSRSVRSRTPSPWSTFWMAAFKSERTSGELATMLTGATCGRPPTTPSAVRIISSASLPWVATTTPIMDAI